MRRLPRHHTSSPLPPPASWILIILLRHVCSRCSMSHCTSARIVAYSWGIYYSRACLESGPRKKAPDKITYLPRCRPFANQGKHYINFFYTTSHTHSCDPLMIWRPSSVPGAGAVDPLGCPLAVVGIFLWPKNFDLKHGHPTSTGLPSVASGRCPLQLAHGQTSLLRCLALPVRVGLHTLQPLAAFPMLSLLHTASLQAKEA